MERKNKSFDILIKEAQEGYEKGIYSLEEYRLILKSIREEIDKQISENDDFNLLS